MKSLDEPEDFSSKKRSVQSHEKLNLLSMISPHLLNDASIAIVFPSERITYRELGDRACLYARSLIGLGVAPGETVGVFMQENIDSIALMMAVLEMGAVVVPINNRNREYELAHCLKNASIKLLVTASDGYRDYSAIAERAVSLLRSVDGENSTGPVKLPTVVCLSGPVTSHCLSKRDFLDAAEDIALDRIEASTERLSSGARAFVIFTSGTTSNPKAVAISHGHMCRIIHSLIDEAWHLTSDDILWLPLPLCHVGGILYAFLSLSLGARLCHCGHFEPLSALRQIQDEGCTVALPGFDTIWTPMVTHCRFREFDLSKLRMANVVGTSESLRKLQSLLPNVHLVSGYGSTETISLTANDPNDSERTRLESCGKPLAGMRLRVVDVETGEKLGARKKGELQCRGAAMFEGYLQAPEATACAFTDDGWYKTGDLCELDEEGYLYFCGRLKDIIRVGGENVAAAEVENLLLKNPKVMIAQAVSVPDEHYGEVVAVFLQLKEGTSATEQEMIEFCRNKIAGFKVPRYIRFLSKWPMSKTKIKKSELRNRIALELAEHR